MINVDLSKAKLTESMESYKDRVAEVHDMIHNKTGAGNDFLGWVDLPTNYNKTEVENIKKKAAELSEEIDVLLVCGIGGSYLGARAAIEAINGLYPTNKVQIIYIGNTFSATYLAQVKNYVKDKEFGINVISKSGTTTETSVAFRIFKELLEETKGKEVAQRRIVARQMLLKAGYPAEMFVTYNLQLQQTAEWWKQLFGESEGKEGKGILPTSGTFSTDLHSLGQFIQEGSKVLFETVLKIKEPQMNLEIPSDADNLDGLNYLAGKTVDYVNQKACEGTIDAHVNVGNVPNIQITLDHVDAYSFGYMVYFFEKACAMSVYLLGVNPFNQPGGEVYKKNMFKLLGKPGY